MEEIEKQQYADELQFNALKKAGCDFSLDHEVDFRFLGPSASLKRIKSTLIELDFKVLPFQESKDYLILIKRMTLGLQSMKNLTAELVSLSQQEGAIYDGWGTKV